MNEAHILKIAGELKIQPRQVLSTAKLFAEGATVPFIARYRKEATGSLDEVAVTSIRERLLALADLDSRREAILKSLAERNLLTDKLQADIAAAEGRSGDAITLLTQAVAVEDGLVYDEPHLWLAPTRHALGAALLAAGRHDDAQRVYREDLRHYPGNGWSLSGLAEALRKAGKADEARVVALAARAAWQHADVPLPVPRF